MNAATFSGDVEGGHASGNVRAATSASSGRSASVAGDTWMGMRSGEVPLGQVVSGGLVEQNDVGDQTAIDVPPAPAAHGGTGGGVLQRGAKVVGGVGVAGLEGVGD